MRLATTSAWHRIWRVIERTLSEHHGAVPIRGFEARFPIRIVADTRINGAYPETRPPVQEITSRTKTHGRVFAVFVAIGRTRLQGRGRCRRATYSQRGEADRVRERGRPNRVIREFLIDCLALARARTSTTSRVVDLVAPLII